MQGRNVLPDRGIHAPVPGLPVGSSRDQILQVVDRDPMCGSLGQAGFSAGRIPTVQVQACDGFPHRNREPPLFQEVQGGRSTPQRSGSHPAAPMCSRGQCPHPVVEECPQAQVSPVRVDHHVQVEHIQAATPERLPQRGIANQPSVASFEHILCPPTVRRCGSVQVLLQFGRGGLLRLGAVVQARQGLPSLPIGHEFLRAAWYGHRPARGRRVTHGRPGSAAIPARPVWPSPPVSGVPGSRCRRI